MEPSQHADVPSGEWGRGRHAYRPVPPLQRPPARYYPAPLPALPPAHLVGLNPRSTWLGRWGLMCSVASFGLPVLAFLLTRTNGGHVVAGVAILTILTPVSAVLGVVFSAVGMSRRYTGRGLAIAGLVVGIVALVQISLGVVVGVTAFSMG